MYTFKEHPRRKRETEKEMDGGERKGQGNTVVTPGAGCIVKENPRAISPIAFSSFLLPLVSFASSSSLAFVGKSFGLSFIRRLCRLATTAFPPRLFQPGPLSPLLHSVFPRRDAAHFPRLFLAEIAEAPSDRKPHVAVFLIP